FGLINTLNLNGRQAPLNIYAPPNLEGILQSVLGDYSHRLQYELVFHGLTMDSAETILETKDCRVSTLVMNHSIECLGFQFEQIKQKPNVSTEKLQALGIEGKTIGQLLAGEVVKDLEGNTVHLEDVTLPSSRGCIYTYCSDTARKPENIQRLNDTDVLYHEATFLNSRQDRAEATGHSTAKDAAWMAKEAGVKDLLIGHFSARYENLEPLLEECQASFTRSHLALEGHSFELSTEGLKLV
ncbi:MAG TPA: ribonuclease Z, partial [Bacteroidetes bacterium]|nr:ribonuclease Z [Bacteroidota bacterium]